MNEEVSFTVSAPGKVILIGEHSVLYKKRGVAVSISKRTFLHFQEHMEAHDQITFNLKNLPDSIEWDFKSVYNLITLNKPLNCDLNEFSIGSPDQIDHIAFVELINDFVNHKVTDGPALNSVKGIFYVILGMLWCTDIDITPFDIEISTDLAIGAGTGSSASFSVCIAAAIYHYIRLKAVQKHGPGEVNISNVVFKPYILKLRQHYCGFSSEEKEIINKWAFCVEKIMHGSPSGLDNTVCAFGNTVLINSGECLDSKLKVVDNFPSFRILLINTGISRSTSNMVHIVSNLHRLCREAAESILSAMDVIAHEFTKNAESLKELTVKEDILKVYRRLEALLDLQQGLLRTLGVSHPRLDEICFITQRRGLHSKLTGAGGGGYAFTLIPPDADEGNIKECVKDLTESGFAVDDLIVNGEGLALDFKSD